ncbi:MAG: Ig-like domain-containing protein [Ruminococcus sp.]|nr:Ig-like domain-containing protein [Ruminococcus sp.]
MNKKLLYKKITALFLAVIILTAVPGVQVFAQEIPSDASFNSSYVDSVTGKKSDKNVLKDDLYLSESEISIDAGDTFKLEAYVSSSVSVMNSVEFSSGDTSVAVVNNKGEVTGYTQGATVITATMPGSGKKAECVVKVNGSVPIPTQPPTQAPTEPPTQQPTEPPTTAPEVDYSVSISPEQVTMYKGCNYYLQTVCAVPVSFKSSNSSVVSVDSRGVITALSSGTATITAYNDRKSASSKITVYSGSNVSISNSSAELNLDRSMRLTASDGVSWSSSNNNVVKVSSDGVIYAQGKGLAVVTAGTSSGAATCLVTVGDYAPIRFAYASPNSAPRNSTVKFRAITDSGKTAVRFKYSLNGNSGWVDADEKTSDGKICIWTAHIKLQEAGTYSVTAYSKTGSSSWETCDEAETTSFVTNSSDSSEPVYERRRASDEIINVIANYEGFLSELTPDPLTGDPTIGYGRVIYSGQKFYNNLTRAEAFAYLVQSVNNDGYAESVNNYFISRNAMFNQQQYDAMVSFTYNAGVNALPGDDDMANVFFNSRTAQSGSDVPIQSGTKCVVTGDYVNVRSGAGTDYRVLETVTYDTTLTLVSPQRYTGSGLGWYNVTLPDGTVGYICEDYISFCGAGTMYNLSKVDKDSFISNFLQWHHAGGCIWGLLYRRVDEAEIFFYGDYERDGSSNKYGFNFTCKRNPDFGIYG